MQSDSNQPSLKRINSSSSFQQSNKNCIKFLQNKLKKIEMKQDSFKKDVNTCDDGNKLSMMTIGTMS